MAKKPKLPFSSPFVLARRPITLITSFSHPVLRGIVRGLLTHICLQKNGSIASNRWLQKVENKMMITATGTMAIFASKELSEDQTSRWIESISNEVQRLLHEPKLHTYRTLNADSGIILPALTRDDQASQQAVYDKLTWLRPYDEIDRQEHRFEWLKKEIPEILKALQIYSHCLHPVCIDRLKCTSPPPDILSEWAKTPNAGALRNNILGHFHGLTPKTVKRRLTACPKT